MVSTPIEIALNEVRNWIPAEILNIVYVRYQVRNLVGAPLPAVPSVPRSWEEGVINDVICGRVLPLANLVGGSSKDIILRNTYIEPTLAVSNDLLMGASPYSIYRIPPEERDFVPISQVMQILPPVQVTGGLGVMGFGSSGGPLQDARNVLESFTAQSHIMRPTVELIGGDLIRLLPAQLSTYEWILTVRLAYDLRLLNLQPSAYLPFAELVVTATKANIYTRTILAMDQGHIQFGQELATFRSIIDGYATANERLNELITNFTGGATLDLRRMAIFISSMA